MGQITQNTGPGRGFDAAHMALCAGSHSRVTGLRVRSSGVRNGR